MLFYLYLNISLAAMYVFIWPPRAPTTKPSAHRLGQAEGAASWKQHMAMGCTTHKSWEKPWDMLLYLRSVRICFEIVENTNYYKLNLMSMIK